MGGVERKRWISGMACELTGGMEDFEHAGIISQNDRQPAHFVLN